MLSIIFYSVWIINIIFVFLKKKSRMLTILSIIIMVVLFYGNTFNSDYNEYLRMYTDSKTEDIEIGFQLICLFGNKLGVTYNELLFVIILIGGTITLFVYSKFSKNYQLFFSLYFIYQVFIDIIQIRNYIATTILLIGFYNLIKRKKMKYLICICLAILFHKTMIFYLPLVFIDVEKGLSVKIIKWSVGIIAIFCVIIFMMGNQIPYLEQIITFFFKGDYYNAKLGYFNTSTRFGFLLYFMLHLSGVYLSYQSNKVAHNNSSLTQNNNTSLKVCDFCLMINLYVTLCFPLIMINMSFYRLFRNIYALNYIAIAIALDSYPTVCVEYFKFVLKVFILNFLYRIPLIHGVSQKEEILNNNFFFY